MRARNNVHSGSHKHAHSFAVFVWLSCVPGRGEELEWGSRRLIMSSYEFRYLLSGLCNMFTEEMTQYQLIEVAVPFGGISAR